ncbi:MAG TPA: GAF and ANTAR domain-containing protein [Trebonia sp.]|jgi:GAF domain-containing protein|nr:GAF and ANTAR domain-containing protein [Trebonia sp.]
MSEDNTGAGVVERLDEVTGHLTELAGVLEAEENLERVLQRSADQVASAVPGADMVSVTVLRGNGAETVAATSGQVWDIDQDQYAAGDGPCLEAARTRQAVRTGVREAERRWPDFVRSSRAAGIESYLSCPLIIDEDFAGSLNLYSEKRHGFADFEVALLRLYTTAACAAIANARRYARARKLADQLGQALDSRAVIDQAIGILIARTGMSADQAFAELSRQSQNSNVKLKDIAARVVTGQYRVDP